MSLKDLIESEAATVFLDTANGFAHSVTRWIAGDSNNTETVSALVEYIDESQRSAPAYLTDSDASGRRQNVTVLLEIPKSQAVAEGDIWVLPNGDHANYVKVAGEDDGEGGLKTILCRVPRGVTTKKTRIRE
jgi:hypothetical protein